MLSTYAVRWILVTTSRAPYISRHAYPVRPPASVAHRQLFRTTGRLFADARRSCHREGIADSDSELCIRVGARVGLSGDEWRSASAWLAATRCASTHPTRAPDPLRIGLPPRKRHPEEATIRRLDHAELRRRILALSLEILGARERKVFLARCMTDDDVRRISIRLRPNLA